MKNNSDKKGNMWGLTEYALIIASLVIASMVLLFLLPNCGQSSGDVF